MEQNKLICNPTVAIRVADSLRADIISGELPPDTRLTTKEIAQRYGVSHMPVREAFQILNNEKFIVMVPYKGAIVAKLNRKFVKDTYGILIALECLMLNDIVPSITSEQIDRLEEINRRNADYLTINKAFHEYLYSISENHEACKLYCAKWAMIRAIRGHYSPGKCRENQGLAQHRQLISALRNRDHGAAVEIIMHHGLEGRDEFMETTIR